MEKGIVRNPAMVIVLSIITCGIYALIWTYKFSSEIKAALAKDSLNPGLELLLCILCFPYIIYWSYKYGKLLGEVQEKAGKPVSDDSILYLILSFVGLHIVTMAIMQSNANKIWEA